MFIVRISWKNQRKTWHGEKNDKRRYKFSVSDDWWGKKLIYDRTFWKLSITATDNSLREEEKKKKILQYLLQNGKIPQNGNILHSQSSLLIRGSRQTACTPSCFNMDANSLRHTWFQSSREKDHGVVGCFLPAVIVPGSMSFYETGRV